MIRKKINGRTITSKLANNLSSPFKRISAKEKTSLFFLPKIPKKYIARVKKRIRNKVLM
ncbi:hypothetical protein K030075H31_43620 [Blautia producta]